MSSSNRIPRKKKKYWKKLWESQSGIRKKIVKKSIKKKQWGDHVIPIWGCKTRTF